MSKYKIFFLFYFLVFPAKGLLSQEENIDAFFQQADNFLKSRVKEGLVSYGVISNNIGEVTDIISLAKDIRYDKKNDTAKALWVNLYNLLVIKSVAENYPIKSPMEVTGFFDREKHQVLGKTFTLNELEKEKLLEVYGDGRLHFVLVCAAKGCPVIEGFAYQPNNLDEQLDKQTRKNINAPSFIRVDKEGEIVKISEIFKWYKHDFTQNGQTILEFINKYRDKKIPASFSVEYYAYDWSLNDLKARGEEKGSGKSGLQSYTPSVLLNRGQWELKNFNNIYTQTRQFSVNGTKTEAISGRKTWFSAINQFLYGINPYINIGFDLWAKSVRIENSADKTALGVLKFEDTPFSRTAITGAGPKIKVAPVKKWEGFSVQSTFLFPLANDLEGRSPDSEKPFLFLENDRYLWLTQFFWDKQINPDFTLFLQFAPWVSFVRRSYRDNNVLETPTSAFGSYFPTKRLTIYAMTEYWPTHYDSGNQQFSPFHSFFVQSGLGGKYQLVPGFIELEVLYTNFWAGSTGGGAGQTYNLGVRALR